MKTMRTELVVEDVKGNQEVAYALLTAEHPLFLNQKISAEEGKWIVESILPPDYYGWESLAEMNEEEQVRHLMNIGVLFDELSDSIYTYELTPHNLFFSRNGIVSIMSRGIVGQVPPYRMLDEDEFLLSFKSMIISLLDTKVSYEALYTGKLPFYKGKLFCEKVANATSLHQILVSLEEKFQKEKKNNHEYFSRVSNKFISSLKLLSIATGLISLFSLIGILYLLFVSLPKQETISQLRLAFVNKNYSEVVRTVKTTDATSLSQDDKYIVAYSVIMTEPLTNEQKEELSKITIQSNADYLRYWVLIGQSEIDKAIDIASFLDDPQLIMYALTKKIDEIQRDPDLTSEERTEKINNLKSKLEELKQMYLTTENTEQSTSNNAQE